MIERDQGPRPPIGARENLCGPCREAKQLAERIGRNIEALDAVRTPEELRAEAEDWLKRAEGLEAGTLQIPAELRDRNEK